MEPTIKNAILSAWWSQSFAAPDSVGGVSLNSGRADFGTSTAHPATNMIAAATANAVLMQTMTRLLVGKSLTASFFFNS